ncbi:Single-stranded DNA-binding protein [Symmachiella dynata]|uniref:Single-stranded DNA-binding protein n=1 Tax=Symmachiella dynata TaxID=2527995 RepID=A0A517ZW10_9PLAN|nr:single-stranded DNA-binding protein [Symmachiella dynata]QDU46660.1 Single-stranded DNA-binding protein [Symmachiella dynata]
MASYNRVILIGNLTRDPEVRYIPSGTAVSELGLAVNRTWFDKQSNSRKEETTFVDVTLWGREAEVAGEYLSKGRPVLIEGRLQLDTWEDKQSGQRRSKLRVVCERMQMLGSRGDGGGGGGGRSGGGGGGYSGSSSQSGYGGGDPGPQAPPQDDFGPSGGGGNVPDDEVPF